MHEWDAAYVLGALSPDERRRFEQHLEGCAECRAAVAELAGMPALLARVPAPELPTVEQHAELAERASRNGLPGATLAALAHRVRRRRIARRWAAAGASVLVAAAIAAAVVLPTTLSSPPRGTQLALTQTVKSPITATVSLTSERWGTEIGMECGYADEPGGAATAYRSYALYVTDASGQATRVASWSAWPGSKIHASGAVATPKRELRAVQVRDVKTGTVLLSSPVK
jgi:hypothetical protein